MDAVTIGDVTFRYFPEGKRNILDHVELRIPEGGITVLTGPSGCGKSTLAALMAGLYPGNGGVLISGDVKLWGRSVFSMRPQERAAYITMLFQDPDLQFCMSTLRKELRFCLENICVRPDEIGTRSQQAAKALGMEALLDRPLDTLSGGEKQKAALCCLLALDSRIFLLDEAFANIDTRTAREIVSHLRSAADRGKTIIAIDHHAELWQGAADRVISMGEAQVVAVPPKRIGAGDVPAVVLRDVTVRRDRVLIEGGCAVFPKGGMSMILGESGSGKTTLFRSLLKQHPYEGHMEVDGRDLTAIRQKELFCKVGVVFQKPADQFITQNVLQEVQASLRLWKRQEDARTLLEGYGLWQYRKYSPYMLSQGQQRKLAVLSVLAGGQEILLLDEPTYGQDSRSTAVMMEQLRRKTEAGLTVICITHDEELAKVWADKIYRLEGRRLYEA
ncbi:MAG: ABC transporter ATP-binding protein [Oscillospiraceae bacterium]|nr:ABC transporter ATP-binding protein [Oscillospiraceae bacterium]